MRKISIFHYHLKPGGVTDVIRMGAEAVIEHLPEVELLRIVCGAPDDIEEIRTVLNKKAETAGRGKAPGFRLEVSICPEIGYSSENGQESPPSPGELAALLKRKFGDSCWWVHNYHLGKNPVFTAALLLTAAEVPTQKILFHIHDFPECARFDNLGRLREAGISNPYPQTPNVAYALINSRDRRILTDAGLPADRIFLLNNPVGQTPPAAEAADPSVRIGRLGLLHKHFRRTFPACSPENRTVFYPVRSIRRKNILEAGLICAASEEKVNLVVGLPGVSAQEKNYSSICEQCFREGLIPGNLGLGYGQGRGVADL